MMVFGRLLAGFTASGLVLASSAVRAQQVSVPSPPAMKEGSLYLQCDGQPNNVTGGETAARLLGAVTLLGLFAPPPESPDASKRKFGPAGVDACTALLEGPKREGNPTRRIHLILGRAVHRIEAKDYDAAIADAELARREMEAAGLANDPYYARSQGRAPDLLIAAALYRQGKSDQAREAALRGAGSAKHNFVSLARVPNYMIAKRGTSEAEEQYFDWVARSAAPTIGARAGHLEELGRFAEAAKLRDALSDYDHIDSPEFDNSLWMAEAAVSHALAGELPQAAEIAAAAQANFDKRVADGKAEGNAAGFVELMDLYGVIRTATTGDIKTARRLFAARSRWVEPSFGAVVEVTRRLRAGAASDELVGGLASDPEALWKTRDAAERAAVLAKDSDNRTLFGLVPAAATASEYEALSKSVWKTTKSSILITKTPPKNGSKLEMLAIFTATPGVVSDAYALHAALLAKSRGQQGFIIVPVIQSSLMAAAIVTGNRDTPGLSGAVFNDADTVIADLSPLIPSPEALQARLAAGRAK